MAAERGQRHPSPHYSHPLEEIARPDADGVRVRFACPYCGEILECVARLDGTRWYLPSCGMGHTGVGVRVASVTRIKSC
jgi:predicted RNA-binding Zn-ribbon protein involved in translation (DUF1610 family)